MHNASIHRYLNSIHSAKAMASLIVCSISACESLSPPGCPSPSRISTVFNSCADLPHTYGSAAYVPPGWLTSISSTMHHFSTSITWNPAWYGFSHGSLHFPSWSTKHRPSQAHTRSIATWVSTNLPLLIYEHIRLPSECDHNSLNFIRTFRSGFSLMMKTLDEPK